MLPDRMDNPHNCPDCEVLREEWDRCPLHEQMVDDREKERTSVEVLFQEIIESFESLDDLTDDIASALTDGTPGVAYKTFHKDIKEYQSFKLEFLEKLGKFDTLLDALALKHAGRTK